MSDMDVVETPGFEDWRPADAPPKPDSTGKSVAWRVGQAVRVFLARVESTDVLLLVGLSMLGRGLYLLLPAAGWAVPGAILVWHQLPQRDRFLKPLDVALAHRTVRRRVPPQARRSR